MFSFKNSENITTNSSNNLNYLLNDNDDSDVKKYLKMYEQIFNNINYLSSSEVSKSALNDGFSEKEAMSIEVKTVYETHKAYTSIFSNEKINYSPEYIIKLMKKWKNKKEGSDLISESSYYNEVQKKTLKAYINDIKKNPNDPSYRYSLSTKFYDEIKNNNLITNKEDLLRLMNIEKARSIFESTTLATTSKRDACMDATVAWVVGTALSGVVCNGCCIGGFLSGIVGVLIHC